MHNGQSKTNLRSKRKVLNGSEDPLKCVNHCAFTSQNKKKYKSKSINHSKN